MPIYEYVCSHCGQEVELWQKITDKPARKCPHCGHRTLRRIISQTSFHLKGTGWYVTDYGRSGSSSSSSKSSKKASNSSGSASSSKD